jgi:myo-inositol-1(or 4)-monophosphatase
MDYTSLLPGVRAAVEKAADFIRLKAGTLHEEDIEIKSRNSLVSFVDKSAEQILVEGLRQLIPEAGFITEVETVSQQQSAFTWIIDPLDGTTNFLQNIPFYSVSVGLQHDDELVLGIVYDVEHREEYYAWKGGGAWCNGERIQVSSRKEIGDAVVATGFPYAAKDVLPQLTAVFDYFLKNGRGIRRLGSAALDLAYVACGRFDIYYETSLHAWDIAGGILLVKEAGGIVTDFHGGSAMLKSGNLISSNAAVHEAAAEAILKIYNS